MEELPKGFFLDADDDLVNFLEKHGEDCIREINQSNTLNKENGQKLLSILIAGIGSIFLLLTQRSTFDYLTAGMLVFLFYWIFCAIYLVRRVLIVKSRGLVSSTPYALYHDDYKGFNEVDYLGFEAEGFSSERSTLNILRRYRLETLTEIADMSKEENVRISSELEKVRLATILTPACASVISALTYFFL